MPVGQAETQVCTKCLEELPQTKEFFYRYSKSRGSKWMECCKACHRDRVNRHAAANRTEVRARNRKASAKFRAKNLDKERERINAYARLHREKKRAQNAFYRQQPEAKAAHAERQRRRTLQLVQATPTWANKRYIALFYWFAQQESRRLGESVHVDHIVPLHNDRVCGLHNEFNLQLMHSSANIAKGNRHWPDM